MFTDYYATMAIVCVKFEDAFSGCMGLEIRYG
jgi:hypothetical protein